MGCVDDAQETRIEVQYVLIVSAPDMPLAGVDVSRTHAIPQAQPIDSCGRLRDREGPSYRCHEILSLIVSTVEKHCQRRNTRRHGYSEIRAYTYLFTTLLLAQISSRRQSLGQGPRARTSEADSVNGCSEEAFGRCGESCRRIRRPEVRKDVCWRCGEPWRWTRGGDPCLLPDRMRRVRVSNQSKTEVHYEGVVGEF